MSGRQSIAVWARAVLLPDLLARYQARDPRYNGIIISDRQAEILAPLMSREECRGGYHGDRLIYCGYVMTWEGRAVYLTKRGPRYLLTFGPTVQEDAEALRAAEDRRHMQDIKDAQRMAAHGNAHHIARQIATYRRELETRADYAADPDNPYRAEDAARADHLRHLLDILTGART